MNVSKLISQMSLEEKACLCSGADFWHTKAIERLNIPAVMMSDGPHGLRKQDQEVDHLGVNDSIKAVCFPAACATAASFDRQILNKIGTAVGDSCQHEKLSTVLGPAVNIKRSPLCGRNFEYFSEDPYLTGELAVSIIDGIQSRGIGTSLKHFAANSQEHRRMSSSAQIDERTLREIYLSAFEKAVKQSQPKTVMCSYNRINGVYASENKRLLTDILRDEWGFKGLVVSDWGAVSNRVKGVEAGLDLEMPGSGGQNDKLIVEAVKNGTLEEKYVDQAAERVLTLVYEYIENASPKTAWDKEAQHNLARECAAECMVLLKNEDDILPLKTNDKIAVIGEFAKTPRFQGGGSSHVNSFKVTSLLDELSGKNNITYSQGYRINSDEIDEKLIDEAVYNANNADFAVVVAGLPDAYESEGYDRIHMNMPDCQNKLIKAVSQANSNTIVILYNGSPIEMPWVSDVKGIIEAYLGGQAVGGATADILFGRKNPCGKLPESFPLKLEDNPSYLYYLGEKDICEYREGVFVGYRYYDKKKMDVLFPFGYGLSYTNFEYSNLKLSQNSMKDSDSIDISVDVTNTGKHFGKEIVQLYVEPTQGNAIRPVRELKGFEKVTLEPGESKTVNFTLSKRAFAYWNMEINDWYVESGKYKIAISKSSRDIELEAEVYVKSTAKLARKYTLDTIILDLMNDEKAKSVLSEVLNILEESTSAGEGSEIAASAITKEMQLAMMKYMPLRSLVSFHFNKFTHKQLQDLLDKINN